MERARRAWIREEARRALLLAGATRPEHIDPVRTAKALDVEIAYGDITGAAERISMLGGRARVRVTDSIVLPGRRAFTITHGVGHKVCGHVAPTGERDVEGWIQYACTRRGSIEEREADVFATEHLTPTPWVRPYCDVATVDLEVVHTMSRVFPVSPVMAAMRFVELTPRACALVYTERGSIKWAKTSRAFPTRMIAGAQPPEDSLARTFFESNVLPNVSRRQFARAWRPTSQSIDNRSEIVEHAMVVPEPGWGGVMSLLWMPDVLPPARNIVGTMCSG